MKRLIHVKASLDRKAYTRNIKERGGIDKLNRMYNHLCIELGIMPVFISNVDRLKDRVDELINRARKNPGSQFYMV